MSTTLETVDLLCKDYIGNYSTGTLRDEIRYRAINRATEYVKRVIGIPNDEEIYTFWYTQDQFFYDLPAKFMEGLQLKYNNPLSNRPDNIWEYLDYSNVLQGVGGVRKNRWSITNINGKKQLVVVGYTALQGQTLLTMDSVTDVTVSGDASGLAVNTVTKYEGTGSISFDITNSGGTASVVFSNLNFDIEELFERNGFIKFYHNISDNTIDSIALRLQSSSGNYYTITTTTADDGTAFAENEWQKIGFHLLDAVATGTPVLTGITEIRLTYDLGSGFTSAADFLIDQLFTAFAEKMDFVMYTNIKGTDSTGVTEKNELTAPEDLFNFTDDYDDYADLIAQRAAINLWPQLRGDKDQFMLLKQEFNENLRTFSRRWPRKRLQGHFRHQLRR